jgi:ABC-2 type transport system permease protein
MLSSVFLKTLHGLRWQILGWGAGVMFIVFITVALFDSFTQTGFEDVIDSMPEQLRGLLGSADNYKSVGGYLAQQIFGLKVVMFLVVMSVLLFISISSSEEDDGRLQTLLTLPITRTKVYFQKWLAVLVAIAGVILLLAGALYAGLAVIGKEADAFRVWQSLASLWLAVSSIGLVGFSTAMLTGKKAVSIGIASSYALFCIIMSSLAPAVKELQDIDRFSLLHYYNNPQIMQHGLDGNHVIILLVVIVALTLLGWLGFTRRSINT